VIRPLVLNEIQCSTDKIPCYKPSDYTVVVSNRKFNGFVVNQPVEQPVEVIEESRIKVKKGIPRTVYPLRYEEVKPEEEPRERVLNKKGVNRSVFTPFLEEVLPEVESKERVMFCNTCTNSTVMYNNSKLEDKKEAVTSSVLFGSQAYTMRNKKRNDNEENNKSSSSSSSSSKNVKINLNKVKNSIKKSTLSRKKVKNVNKESGEVVDNKDSKGVIDVTAISMKDIESISKNVNLNSSISTSISTSVGGPKPISLKDFLSAESKKNSIKTNVVTPIRRNVNITNFATPIRNVVSKKMYINRNVNKKPGCGCAAKQF